MFGALYFAEYALVLSTVVNPRNAVDIIIEALLPDEIRIERVLASDLIIKD